MLAQVMIECPVTGQPSATGLKMDPTDFSLNAPAQNCHVCRHCGQKHTWKKEDAWFLMDRAA